MANVNVKRVKSSDIELKDRLVAVNRVTKVTKGGRTFSFTAIVVVGNEKGVVGYGLGKAKEVTDAISKAVEDAKKNLVKVSIINGTVPHVQEGKFGGSLVFLKPASNGTGVIAAQSWSIHRTCPHDTRSPPVDSPGNSPDMLSQGRHSELLQSKGSSFPVHRLPHEHAPTRHSSSPDG